MFDLEKYINDLIFLLKGAFKPRLLYVGLQGSYLRNEATESSDIDIMVILESMTVQDLDTYKNALMSVGYYEKSCGFICGKSEMAHWNPLEIGHLLRTTKDMHGKLVDYVPMYTVEDERNFIKISLNNMYHALCHRYIHADEKENIVGLSMLYKSVFFILQNKYYIQSGKSIATKRELLNQLDGEDKMVLEMSFKIQDKIACDFDDAFDLLFSWCQHAIVAM